MPDRDRPQAQAVSPFRSAIAMRAMLECAARTGEPVHAIVGRGKRPHLCHIRFAVVTAARALEPPVSFPLIGRTLNRDHSSTQLGLRRGLDMMQRDPAFAAFVIELYDAALAALQMDLAAIDRVRELTARLAPQVSPAAGMPALMPP